MIVERKREGGERRKKEKRENGTKDGKRENGTKEDFSLDSSVVVS